MSCDVLRVWNPWDHSTLSGGRRSKKGHRRGACCQAFGISVPGWLTNCMTSSLLHAYVERCPWCTRNDGDATLMLVGGVRTHETSLVATRRMVGMLLPEGWLVSRECEAEPYDAGVFVGDMSRAQMSCKARSLIHGTVPVWLMAFGDLTTSGNGCCRSGAIKLTSKQLPRFDDWLQRPTTV